MRREESESNNEFNSRIIIKDFQSLLGVKYEASEAFLGTERVITGLQHTSNLPNPTSISREISYENNPV